MRTKYPPMKSHWEESGAKICLRAEEKKHLRKKRRNKKFTR